MAAALHLILVFFLAALLLVTLSFAQPVDSEEDDEVYTQVAHVRDWKHDSENVPFNDKEKADTKACYHPHKKSQKGKPRVCTKDGKGFKNRLKYDCARQHCGTWGYTAKAQIVDCPPNYTG